MNYKRSLLVGAAIAGLSLSACTTTNTSNTGSKVEGECHGINACKGQGACGGKGSSCAGTNACKGKGWLKTAENECVSKGGKFVKG
ncbi:hypothetical protein [Leptospira idonii]|uniref:Lipoprotein n=1 Tax=Leptospira idonii TaxID=1193500 RepID=A0A4R9M672_9LEPT|nr:hypothetical protein [Leptospira idonii]TGN20679.1 hypothetical protein EHS15_02130 [Leptospira idonii]